MRQVIEGTAGASRSGEDGEAAGRRDPSVTEPLPGPLARWRATPLALRVVAFGVLYLLLAVGGAPLSPVEGVAVLWLPAGLTVAVLLISDRREWPWLLAALVPGGALFDVLYATPPLASAGFIATNVVQAWLGAWLVQRWGGSVIGWRRLRPVAVFFLGAAVAAPAIGGIFGGATSAASFGGSFASAWAAWFIGDAIGIALVGPLVLAWVAPRAAPPAATRLEAVGVLFATAAVGVLAFAPADLRFSFLALLPLVYAGLRLRPPSATLAVAVVAVVEIVQAVGGFGAFRDPATGLLRQVQTLQLFLGVAAVVTGLLVAQAAERRRAQAQQAALEREAWRQRARLGLAVESAELGVWEWDLATGEVHWSEGTERIFGLEPGSFSGRIEEFVERSHPDDRDRIAEAIRRALEEDQDAYRIDHRLVRPDGTVRWAEGRGVVLRGEGRTPVGMIGVIADVTEQRTSRERLVRHARHQEALATLGTRALQVDGPERFLEDALELLTPAFGEATLAAHRYLADTGALERVGAGDDRLPSTDAERNVAAAALGSDEPVLVQDGPSANGDLRQEDTGNGPDRAIAVRIPGSMHPHGVLTLMGASPATAPDDARVLASAASLISTVLELHRVQLERMTASKMEAVGRLAGGIAHDFNNLLTGILGLAELSRLHTTDDRLVHNLQEMQNLGRRAAALVDQLLAFSRGASRPPVDVELGAAVTDVVGLLDRIIGEQVTIETAPPSAPVWIRIDPVQLEQVIVNLAINARDAMPAGGVLGIEVEAVDGEGEVRQAVLRVSDAGTGMSPEVAARAVEPFFTTKAAAGGSGLGLATVYGIVERAGGRVAIDSVPGRGTTVEIRFDAVTPVAVSPSHETADVDAGTRGVGRVLVAEDAAIVREVVHDVLVGAGYEVAEATDGQTARELLDRQRFDVLVTDVVMPRLPGPELVAHAAEHHPAVRIVVMSGYADTGELPIAPSRVTYLPKPFTVAELLTAVGQSPPGSVRTATSTPGPS
ncbi:MASE1 domain-containing protein [Egicoccus sp. AB-alg6-2]|uniref:MASE1 domain-containing protein n=1 Tax=Egicoccus sp. AB-alg6-2 TaxID=3242692 RepID=UPI00359D22EB